MRKLGWDGGKSTYAEYLKGYRLYMAGLGADGGRAKVPKGFSMTRKKVDSDAEK